MERNSKNSHGFKLESQLREAYGKIVYTYTCHNKKATRLLKLNDNIKVWQIVLSALSAGGFITTIIFNDTLVKIIGAVISFLLVIVNSYTKNFNLVVEANEHIKTANLLWKIREEYISLLIDFEILSVEEIMAKRDELQNRTFEVYSSSLSTDKKSYKEAQKSLKTEEEQTFSEKEIDVMLPSSIRRETREFKEK
jgi:hypothetical protein